MESLCKHISDRYEHLLRYAEWYSNRTRARAVGYRRMFLETLRTMLEARALYALLGFRPCAPCYYNSCLGRDCFELTL